MPANLAEATNGVWTGGVNSSFLNATETGEMFGKDLWLPVSQNIANNKASVVGDASSHVAKCTISAGFLLDFPVPD